MAAFHPAAELPADRHEGLDRVRTSGSVSAPQRQERAVSGPAGFRLRIIIADIQVDASFAEKCLPELDVWTIARG